MGAKSRKDPGKIGPSRRALKNTCGEGGDEGALDYLFTKFIGMWAKKSRKDAARSWKEGWGNSKYIILTRMKKVNCLFQARGWGILI